MPGLNEEWVIVAFARMLLVWLAFFLDNFLNSCWCKAPEALQCRADMWVQ